MAAKHPARLPETDPAALDIQQFIEEYGRFPQLGRDPIAPWKYRGYLLYYLTNGVREKAPEVVDRWDYYFRTREAGRLLDEPIPQIDFGHEGKSVDEGSAGHKELDKWVAIAEEEHGGAGAFRALLDWLQWGLALSNEYPKLTEKTQEALYRGVNLEPLLKHPYDYLGGFYQSTKTSRWNRSGYYCTPHNVVEMMVRMTMGDGSSPLPDGRDLRTATVCDPAVGSGRMLLHASNYSLCLYGQDIDPICCAMTKINGAFYAPWMSFPLPASVLNRPVPLPPPAPLPVQTEESEIETAIEPVMVSLHPGETRPLFGETKKPVPPRKQNRIDDHRQPRLFE